MSFVLQREYTTHTTTHFSFTLLPKSDDDQTPLLTNKITDQRPLTFEHSSKNKPHVLSHSKFI